MPSADETPRDETRTPPRGPASPPSTASTRGGTRLAGGAGVGVGLTQAGVGGRWNDLEGMGREAPEGVWWTVVSAGHVSGAGFRGAVVWRFWQGQRFGGQDAQVLRVIFFVVVVVVLHMMLVVFVFDDVEFRDAAAGLGFISTVP